MIRERTPSRRERAENSVIVFPLVAALKEAASIRRDVGGRRI
jgi:hypothetical protein